MQASQSSNATEFLKSASPSDSHLIPHLGARPDSTVARIVPSAFSAPIQAARKYLERQRSDAGPSGPREARTLGGPHAHQGGEDEDREQSGRERSRRLERSLYGGHSVEAGLNFDAGMRENDGGDAGGEDGGRSGRAYLAEEEHLEPIFLYATPGPAPDPELVRGAILRLARESEMPRHQTEDLRQQQRTPEAGGQKLPPAASFAGMSEAVGGAREAVQLPAFGDVARRVWGEAAPGQGFAEAGFEGDLEKETWAAEESELGGRVHGGSSSATSEYTASFPAGLRTESGIANFVGNAEPGVAREADERPAGRIASETRQLKAAQQTAVAFTAVLTPGCGAEEQSALAHDACNLLSALSLYSELLGAPGVLAVAHRHYAEELRLLAGRSRILIDRLLQGSVAQDGTVSAIQLATRSPGAEAALIAGEDDAETFSGTSVNAGPSCYSQGRENLHSLPVPHELQSFEKVPEFQEAARPVPDGTSSSAASGDTEAPRANLADLLLRWGSLLSTLAQGTLEVVLGPHASTPVPVGAEALERILVNLVRNARAATVLGGAIRIGAATVESALPVEGETGVPVPSRTMVLTVDDSGCGMTQSQLRRILGTETPAKTDRVPVYESRDTAATDGYGRWPGNGRYARESDPELEARSAAAGREPRQGLGLQIVRGLVAKSGGELSIQSRPGMGTRIEIRWPVGVPDIAPAAEASAAVRQAQMPADGQPVAALAAELIAPQTACDPGLAGQAPPPAIPGEATRAAAGLDGFSQAELRAMVLRLQRGATPERGPFSRRLGDRRPFAERRMSGSPASDAPEDGRAFPGRSESGTRADEIRADEIGANQSRADLPDTGQRFGVVRVGAGDCVQNRPVPQDVTRKGAIAC